ncbi:hypothetical protein [Marinifilum fragile]|uniref:hypothetical protein n=1 Tax=Marinifilum fragile TaxID=570161 RepID=UPI002AAAAA9E|nr:hypothetical protein [Marinifilum fragile]
MQPKVYGSCKYRRNYMPLINEDRLHATEEKSQGERRTLQSSRSRMVGRGISTWQLVINNE